MDYKMYSQTAPLLGTLVELQISASSKKDSIELFNLLWQKIAIFEGRFSRFLTDSELSYVNKNAGKKTFITEAFMRWVKTLDKLHLLSAGYYNPFCLPDIQKQGYLGSITRDFKCIDSLLDYRDRRTVSISNLTVGKNWIKIPKNSALDSGGNGKGYIADILSDFIKKYCQKYALSLGGDIICKSDDASWEIPISDVHNKKKIINYYSSSKKYFAIATSTKDRSSPNTSINHIVNLNSEKKIPSKISSCTVVTSEAISADVLASCVVIAGSSYLDKLLSDGAVTAGLIQYTNGKTYYVGSGFLQPKGKNSNKKWSAVSYA